MDCGKPRSCREIPGRFGNRRVDWVQRVDSISAPTRAPQFCTHPVGTTAPVVRPVWFSCRENMRATGGGRPYMVCGKPQSCALALFLKEGGTRSVTGVFESVGGLGSNGRQVAAPTHGWLWPIVGDDGNRPVRTRFFVEFMLG